MSFMIYVENEMGIAIHLASHFSGDLNGYITLIQCFEEICLRYKYRVNLRYLKSGHRMIIVRG